MRINLKIFRVRNNLTQQEISEKIGCQRVTYSAIENGKRNGRQSFWNDLQTAFSIPENEMWELMKNSEA